MPYFDDDGTELNPDLMPKPHLCVACANDETNDEMERILCTLTRLDQQAEDEFICHAFREKTVTR
ncbi:MAG TPA: hypothetical protein VFG50_12460 [Rhodothermales bacterium]|nr:hypothetical protein [Rhodothermales bacterium]